MQAPSSQSISQYGTSYHAGINTPSEPLSYYPTPPTTASVHHLIGENGNGLTTWDQGSDTSFVPVPRHSPQSGEASQAQGSLTRSAEVKAGNAHEEARIVLACINCRTRKVRCDGGRPACSNCRKRHTVTTCSYDAIPKRRGPDKNPGRIRGPNKSNLKLEQKKQAQSQKKQMKAKKGTEPAILGEAEIGPDLVSDSVTGVLNDNSTAGGLTLNAPPRSRPLAVLIPATVPGHAIDRPTVVSAPPTDQSSTQLVSRIFAAPLSSRSFHSPASHVKPPDIIAPAAVPQSSPGPMPGNTPIHARPSPYGSMQYYETDIPSVPIRSRHTLRDLLHPPPSASAPIIHPDPSVSHSSLSHSIIPSTTGHQSQTYPSAHLQPHAQSTIQVLPSIAAQEWIPESSASTSSQYNVPSHAFEHHPQSNTWTSPLYDYDVFVPTEGYVHLPHYHQRATLQEWDDQNDTGGVTQPLSGGIDMRRASPTNITREPSLHFARDIWWDTVINMYQSFSSGPRHEAAMEISTDIYNFFKISSPWLSFINVPLFLSLFHHSEHRTTLQPALVIGMLAYAKYLQSHRDCEEGSNVPDNMYRKSIMLRELAQSAFEASYNGGWIDTSLAQAGWVIALYEASAHPNASFLRMESAIILLDNVICALGLTSIDKDNPRACNFAPRRVPALGRPRPDGSEDVPANALPAYLLPENTAPPQQVIHYQATTQPTPFDLYRNVGSSSAPGTTRKGCPCHSLSMAGSPEAATSTPLWLCTPRWDGNSSWAEIKKEEARRLVWSSVALMSGDAAARLAFGRRQLNLHVSKPENFAVLHSGERLYASSPAVDAAFSGKESTWSLYGRTMQLWYACVIQLSEMKLRTTPNYSGRGLVSIAFTPEELAVDGQTKADFAMRAWMETLAIEEALNEHTCDGEKSTMYQAREYLFTIRMFISGGFRQYIPQPRSQVDFSRIDRQKAMQWLHHQNNVATQLQNVISSGNSHARQLLVKRPYLIWWQMNQLGRALQLSILDRSLTFAIDVAFNVLPVLNWFEKIWPCEEQRKRGTRLRAELDEICRLVGRPNPG